MTEAEVDPTGSSAASAEARPPLRAVRSTVVAIAGNAASQVLRLGSNLVLTHLLFPEAFGLMSIVFVAIQGMQLLSDVGIIPSVIQHPRGDDGDFLDTAWTLSGIRSIALFLISLLLAWPFSVFYGQPELLALIPAVSIAMVFAGFESTLLALAWRHMQQGRIVLVDLGAQLVSFAVNCLGAWLTQSVWALVAGVLVSQVLKTAATHLLLPGRRNRFRLERLAVADLLSFGKWVFLSTLITFFASRLDVLLLGKLLPIDKLGVYSLASMLAVMPSVVLGAVLGSVVTPLLARAHRGGAVDLQRTYARVRRFFLPAAGFLSLGTALGAPGFFGLLYDGRYHEAMWMAPLLTLQGWWAAQQEAATRTFLAAGDPRPLVPSNLLRLAISAPGALLGHAWFGLPGFIIGQAFGALAGALYLDVVLERRGLPSLRQDLMWSTGIIGIGAAALYVTPLLEQATGLGKVPVSIAVGVVVLAGYAAAFGPRTVRAYRQRAEGADAAPAAP